MNIRPLFLCIVLAASAVAGQPPQRPDIYHYHTVQGSQCPKCGNVSPRIQSIEVIGDVVLNENVKGSRGTMLKYNLKCGKCTNKYRALEIIPLTLDKTK